MRTRFFDDFTENEIRAQIFNAQARLRIIENERYALVTLLRGLEGYLRGIQSEPDYRVRKRLHTRLVAAITVGVGVPGGEKA